MLLIDNADYLLTMDIDRRVLRHASLAIEDARIVDVGRADLLSERYRERLAPEDIIEGRGTLLVPGFVNTHAHTMEHLSRGLIPDTLATLPWALQYFFPFQIAMTEEEAYVSARLSCLDMLHHGTTCFLDASILNSNRHVDAVAQAVEESGLRAVLGRGVCDRTPDDLPPGYETEWRRCMAAASTQAALREVRSMMARWDTRAAGRIRAWPTVFGLFSLCTDELFVGIKQLADELGAGTNFHVASSVEEAGELEARAGVWPITRLHELGVLDTNVLLTHAVMVREDEVALLADTGTKIAHCPGAALRLGKGVTHHGKIPEMLAADVTVSLGTDGVCSCGTFDHVRTASLVAGLFKDARVDASLIPAETALEMITRNGADALLMTGELGTLERGCYADLLQFDLQRPEWTPNHDPVRTLVYSADGSSIRNVFVNGRRVLCDGVASGVDEIRTLDEAHACAERIAARVGLDPRSAWPAANADPDARPAGP